MSGCAKCVYERPKACSLSFLRKQESRCEIRFTRCALLKGTRRKISGKLVLGSKMAVPSQKIRSFHNSFLPPETGRINAVRGSGEADCSHLEDLTPSERLVWRSEQDMNSESG